MKFFTNDLRSQNNFFKKMFKQVIDCPELFFEILRFIPDIQNDLLSLILINKQSHKSIENYNSKIFYQLLCKDRLNQDTFNNLLQQQEEELKTIKWKEQFLQLTLFSWSEYLQTLQPLQQINEKNSEHIFIKCRDHKNHCSLFSNKYFNFQKHQIYRHIRSKHPILKDTTLHFYTKYLIKNLKHDGRNFLLFGIMNENVCNAIVGKQEDYSYLGEIKVNGDNDQNLYYFNTGYASNGYICCTEQNERQWYGFKSAWGVEEDSFISIEVTGIKEGNIEIKYYFNGELVYKYDNILRGVDVVNEAGHRLYFAVGIEQTNENVNNTVVIGSSKKLDTTNFRKYNCEIQ